ncbi:hypothetical protein KBD08_04610 [Candidatus Babeliales bacterium]|nr:hypothetical protein [Candidatus Babeliales bacterium]
MSRWLPSVRYKHFSQRQLFLRDIFIIVIIGHLLLLGIMMLGSMIGAPKNSYSVSLYESGATYVLMPFHKTIQQPKDAKKSSNRSALKKSKIVDYDTFQKKRKKSTSQSASVKAQATQKASSAHVKTSKGAAKTSVKLSSKTTAQQPKNTKNKSGKVAHKSVMAASVAPELPDVPQQVLQQILEQPKLPTQEVVPDVVTTLEPVVQEQLPSQLVDEQETIDENEVIFVGYEQLDECVISSKLQQAIVQVWTSPVGMQEGISCTLKVTVSSQGTADNVVVQQSSGIFVYDSCARTALLQTEYPQEVWNKKIIIALGN